MGTRAVWERLCPCRPGLLRTEPPGKWFPCVSKRDRPQEELCLPRLTEVIPTQPGLWDAVGIGHGGHAVVPHQGTGSVQELRVRETLGAISGQR